jgi:hypothetical protein
MGIKGIKGNKHNKRIVHDPMSPGGWNGEAMSEKPGYFPGWIGKRSGMKVKRSNH